MNSTPALDPPAEARFDNLEVEYLTDVPEPLNLQPEQEAVIKAHLAMEKELSRKEGEEALARKILAISGKHRKQKGLTNSVRLEIITKKVLEHIPGSFIFEEAFTPPQATPQKESHD